MGEVVTLCAGLTKKVTKAGGGERPQQGDRCSMHYTGTLEDGTTFDTSRTRPAPFSFTLGRGEVIQGWDIGVATMAVGEQATLTIAPELGYGDEGAGGGIIPSGATLTFDVRARRDLAPASHASMWRAHVRPTLVPASRARRWSCYKRDPRLQAKGAARSCRCAGGL